MSYLVRLFNKMMPSYGSLHMMVWPPVIWSSEKRSPEQAAAPRTGDRTVDNIAMPTRQVPCAGHKDFGNVFLKWSQSLNNEVFLAYNN